MQEQQGQSKLSVRATGQYHAAAMSMLCGWGPCVKEPCRLARLLYRSLNKVRPGIVAGPLNTDGTNAATRACKKSHTNEDATSICANAVRVHSLVSNNHIPSHHNCMDCTVNNCSPTLDSMVVHVACSRHIIILISAATGSPRRV